MERTSDQTRLIAASILDTWLMHDWRNGVQLSSLDAFTEIRVQTRNSVYEITLIDGDTGEVLIRGGQLFPERTAVRLAGSTRRGSFLKAG